MIRQRRGDANRLGVAVQLCLLRYPGVGIVTKIVLDVLPRPYATTLKGEVKNYLCEDKAAFISRLSRPL